MTVIRQEVGYMSLDAGPKDGDHLWAAQDVIVQDGGYEKMPEWSELYTQSVTSGHLPQGVHCWRGGYAGRIYLATNSKFFELTDSAATDVTGSTTPANATNGVKFASYGEWVFAANGVDKIQTMKVPSTTGSATNFEDMVYTTGGAKIAPKYICSHKNHLIAANITFVESYGEIATATTGAGGAFTNQPTNDFIELISDSASDINSVAIYGTTNGGGDAVTVEVLTMTGLTAKKSTTSNWNKILGWNLQSTTAVGTITLRKFTGGATIATIAPLGAASGIYNVPAVDQAGGDRVIDIVASGATTKQVGIVGTTPGGANYYDSQALSGTTTVQSNSEFRTVTNILIGDIENTVTVTFSSHQYPNGYSDPFLVWWSGVDDPEGYGTEVLRPQISGSGNQPLLDGTGKVTGVIDGGDCFFVFKEGCIYRFDGPPFQPTIISYSFGMKAGLLPYRQNDRVYFWSDSGLAYIDIKTNEITPTMGKTTQRAVIDYANYNYGSAVGSYPKQRTSTKEAVNCVSTGSGVTISGDSVNSLVVVMFRNASIPGGHGLVYHELTGAFTVLSGPSGSNSDSAFLVDYRPGSGEIPGILSSLRLVFPKTQTLLSLTKTVPTGYAEAGTRDGYFRWPFKGAQPGGSTTRVVRVRPIFNNPVVTSSENMSIHVSVYSLSGVGKSWVLHSVLSVGQNTKSLDGWITVDGCPLAERHSIGVSFLASGSSSNPDPLMSGFVGIDVDVVSGSSKGI